jgi:hypothetical protein
MTAALTDLARKLAEEDISREEGQAKLSHEGKALIPSIGFMAAVEAMADAQEVFERHHLAASERRLRQRNQIKGFRLIPKLG